MHVTAATPAGAPGAPPGEPDAGRPAAHARDSGDPEPAGPESGGTEFSGTGFGGTGFGGTGFGGTGFGGTGFGGTGFGGTEFSGLRFSGPGSAGQVSPELASAVASFPGMIDTLRELQNRITSSVPSQELAAEVSRTLTDLAIRLGAYAVDERAQIAGRMDLPGRGQALVPVIYLDEQDDQHAAGRVTFGRFYLGSNGAAHGGAIPLVFDDVLGRLANTGGRPPSRTAYLHINYRRITPIDRELQLTARFDREEGRKRFLAAELRDGGRLCADAEGLFVALRPGQP